MGESFTRALWMTIIFALSMWGFIGLAVVLLACLFGKDDDD